MKIAITSDTTRIAQDGRPVPTHNTVIMWMKTLFEPLWENIEDLDFRTVLSKEHVFGSSQFDFDLAEIYKICNLEVSNKSWAKLFSGKLEKEELEAVEQYILSYYNDFDFIIGYELPDIFIYVFNKHKIPYIDIFLHPIRFYKDLILSIRTNVSRIHKVLLKDNYFLSQKYIYNNTNFERAKLCITKGLGLQDNSCLFLGQINADKSIINNGKIYSLFDFKDQFEDFKKQYDKVYFKIHPYMAKNEKLVKYLNALEFVEVIDQTKDKYREYNIYRMIAQKSIKKVYSITSSGCYEAEFIGKETEWLLEYPFKITKNKSEIEYIKDYTSSEFIPLKPEQLFNQNFWLEIFDRNEKSLINKNAESNYIPGQIRSSKGMSWGYSFFE